MTLNVAHLKNRVLETNFIFDGYVPVHFVLV